MKSFDSPGQWVACSRIQRPCCQGRCSPGTCSRGTGRKS
jgi:hypothetical protein